LKTQTSSNRAATAFWAVLLVLSLTLTVWAQPGPQERGPRWGREQIETVIIGKFATELNLSSDQAEKFFPRFREFQNQTEDLQRQQMERRRALEELSTNPEADPQQVDGLLKDQSRQEQQMMEFKQHFLMDVSHFLTPQQVSRCSILMDDLPRRVHEFIQERRQERGMNSPQGPGSYPPGRGRRRGY
jgi:Spy/CpxP family protein refolding chaperone